MTISIEVSNFDCDPQEIWNLNRAGNDWVWMVEDNRQQEARNDHQPAEQMTKVALGDGKDDLIALLIDRRNTCGSACFALVGGAASLARAAGLVS